MANLFSEPDKELLLDSTGGYAPVTVEDDGHKMVSGHRSGAGFGVGTFVNDEGEEEQDEIDIYVLGLKTQDGSEYEFIFQEDEIVAIASDVARWQIDKLGRNQ